MLAFILSLFGILIASGGSGRSSSSDSDSSRAASTADDDTSTENELSDRDDDEGSPSQDTNTSSPIPTTPNNPTAPNIPTIPTTDPSDGSDTTPPETSDPVVAPKGETISVEGGRVNKIEVEADTEITSIEILDKPEHGNATVSPDNTIALVMSGSDFAGDQSMRYQVTFEDGSSEIRTLDMDVSAPTQDAGWGHGQHYMLEEDENGDIIVETGENHRKVYVSESDDALTRSDIAALEGLEESQITISWLVDHPEYGGSEGMALSTDLGMDVWRDITIWTKPDPVSHWLLFESGYEYDEDAIGRVINFGATGESELHPIHITSWGEGDRPVISGRVYMTNAPSENIVFSDLTFTGEVSNVTADNTLFSDVGIYEKGIYVQHVEGFTVHDSEIAYVGANANRPDGDYWPDTRVEGLFAADVDQILIEGNIVHHNGWEDNYEFDSSTTGGLPPSKFSHNIYLQNDTTDVTLRDNIISEGSSFGAHVRGGGFIEDNAFINNNMAIDFLGGDYLADDAIGNYTLFSDNVITSAAYKYLQNYHIGAVSGGFQNGGVDSTLIDNIVTHLADPNDPDDIIGKHYANSAVINDNDPFYDDTIVYNWVGELEAKPNQNIDGLDTSTLDDTTIQNLAEIVMGREATITEFMDYLLGLTQTEFDDVFSADDIIAYFQNGFSVDPNGDEAQTDHTFVPNNIADGVRWDNRLNWNTEDVPDNGDDVDLNGNWVQYGATTTIGDLDLGSGGKLDVNYGRLTVDDRLNVGEDGGEITTRGAGQFWTDGYSDGDRLTINVEDGRFANTGTFDGSTSIEIDDGQAILATHDAKMVLNDDSELRINGSDARVGFDGTDNGTAILQMGNEAVLTFAADDEGFSALQEFRSGKWGDQDSAEVKSGVSLDGALQIDLSNYTSGTATHTLVKVDALDGVFDDIHVHGLANNMNARIVTDYATDELRLELTNGSGQVSYDSLGTAGSSSGEASDLWAALTSGQGVYDNNAPTLHDETEDLPDILAA